MLGIRTASVEEVPSLLGMILEFATFEKLREEVKITEAILARDGFGAPPRFRTLIAEWNRQPAGYAICFPVYSTFLGPAPFLEDVYVRPQFAIKGSARRWRRSCGDGAARGMRRAALGSACMESVGY